MREKNNCRYVSSLRLSQSTTSPSAIQNSVFGSSYEVEKVREVGDVGDVGDVGEVRGGKNGKREEWEGGAYKQEIKGYQKELAYNH